VELVSIPDRLLPAFNSATVHRQQEKDSAMGEKFERHRQPWKQEEIQKLHQLAGKGMALRAIAKALTRSEESVKQRAKEDGLKIAKLR
jgi:hypothetical protein